MAGKWFGKSSFRMKSHEDVSAREGKDDKKKERDGALDRARTDDLRLIRATRYQLRYESCARIKSVPNQRPIILKRNVIKVEIRRLSGLQLFSLSRC